MQQCLSRARNVVVAAVAALAVLAGGAALLIGAGARSASVVQAQENGNELCGWIGVKVSPMTAPFAESLGMAEPYGAIFERPEPGSPAAAAHIEAGDVLTAINGSPLMRSSDFAGIISAMAPGTSVYLDTWRDRQATQVTVVLGSAPCHTSG
jgi:serine protease Do